MIVVEGPDGAGKTTLVGQLLERLPELKLGERQGEDSDRSHMVYEDTLHAMSRAIRHTEHVYVYDRLWISELVYSTVFGREPGITPQQAELLIRLDKAAAWPLIICLPPFDVVKVAVESAPQMEGVVERIDDIYQSYFSVLNAHGYWKHDWTRPGRFNMLIGYLEGYLHDRKERGPRWASQLG